MTPTEEIRLMITTTCAIIWSMLVATLDAELAFYEIAFLLGIWTFLQALEEENVNEKR